MSKKETKKSNVERVRKHGALSQEVACDSDVRKNRDNLNSACKAIRL